MFIPPCYVLIMRGIKIKRGDRKLWKNVLCYIPFFFYLLRCYYPSLLRKPSRRHNEANLKSDNTESSDKGTWKKLSTISLLQVISWNISIKKLTPPPEGITFRHISSLFQALRPMGRRKKRKTKQKKQHSAHSNINSLEHITYFCWQV